jgi:hypothetical protein
MAQAIVCAIIAIVASRRSEAICFWLVAVGSRLVQLSLLLQFQSRAPRQHQRITLNNPAEYPEPRPIEPEKCDLIHLLRELDRLCLRHDRRDTRLAVRSIGRTRFHMRKGVTAGSQFLLERAVPFFVLRCRQIFSPGIERRHDGEWFAEPGFPQPTECHL